MRGHNVRQRYEHRRVYADWDDQDRILGIWQKNGWELCGNVSATYYGLWLYFKRPCSYDPEIAPMESPSKYGSRFENEGFPLDFDMSLVPFMGSGTVIKEGREGKWVYQGGNMFTYEDKGD